MNEYLYWSGVGANIILLIFAALCIWVWFIWPFVEAVSITRCFIRASIVHGRKPALKDIIRSLRQWYLDLLFGRSWTRIHNRKFEWEGVGNWRVYRNEED